MQVAESGLDFVIVRSAKNDSDPDAAESGVTVTPQGSLTSSSKVTKTQVRHLVSHTHEVSTR